MVKLPLAAMVRVAPLCTSTDLATAAVLAEMMGRVLTLAMMTSFVAVGTLAGVQLQGVAQSVLSEPFQVSMPVGVGVGVQAV